MLFTILIYYWLLSLLLMTFWIHYMGKKFYDHTKKIVQEHNEKLLKKLKDKKISPFVYYESLMDFESERRHTVIVNYIIAPFKAPQLIALFTLMMLIYILTGKKI
jgi:hypothetical protein